MNGDGCTTHVEAPAGWNCDACRKQLCGECTAKAANVYYCALCGGTATQLVSERTDRPFSRWVLGAFAYPILKGLPIVAVMAILLGGAAYTFAAMGNDFDGWAIAVRAVLLGAFVLVVVDSSARGGVAERGAPLRLLRGMLATLILWGPVAAAAYVLGTPRHDWTFYMLLGLAAVYVPIALAVAVTDVTIGTAMNPFAVFAFAWRLGRRYLAMLVAVIALGALAYGVYSATAAKLAHSITAPVAGDIAAVLPGLAMLAVVFHVVGLLVHVHGESLGFGSAAEYRDPILPNAVASARRKDAAVLTTEQLTKGNDLAGVSAEERGDIRKIHDFLKGENLARALAIYQGREAWPPQAFEDRHLLALGKAAQRAKNFPLAERLFEEGLAKNGRAASQILVARAQLLGDAMGRADDARLVYEQVVTKFPGSDAAKIALQRLGR